MSEGERNKGGRPSYEPTDKDRRLVKAMASYRVPQHDIARVIGIHDDTMRKYYQDDFDHGRIIGLAKVKESMFWMATEGRNVSAAIFILKTQDPEWRDAQQHEITGKDGAPLVIVSGVRRRGEGDED